MTFEEKLRGLAEKRDSIAVLERRIGSLEHEIKSVGMDYEPVREKILAQNELAARLERERAGAQILEKCLDGLDRDEKRVIELLVIKKKSGNTQRLIDELHMSQATIYRVRARALDKLRRALGQN